MELSLPKFWYRHNIWLLYDFSKALDKLKELLETQLEIKFIYWMEWEIFRLDVCYAWKCPNQDISQSLLNSLKKLNYPKKQKVVYEESITFLGATYSIKFYLKYPEFMKHDYKILKKQNIGRDNLRKLQNEALGVIRCETTLRRQYLKKNDLIHICQLYDGGTEYTDDEQLRKNYPDIQENYNLRQFVAACIVKYHKPKCTVSLTDYGIECSDIEYEKLWSGGVFNAPQCEVEINDALVQFKGGGFISEFTPDYVEKFNTMIGKLIGEHRGLNEIDKIKEKLESKYVQSKAARLIFFWISIQRFGSKEVKRITGDDSFYRSKRALREAGIGIVEPVRVINAAKRFKRDFKFEIPSQFVVNGTDHARGSEDVLEFPSQKEA